MDKSNISNTYPCARNTSGVFLEHFELGPAEGGGDQIIYRRLYETAARAAEVADWGFRSFSAAATSGTRADFMERNIRSFPTLILYRDGGEMGRHTAIHNTVRGILDWAGKLLGEDFDFPESALVMPEAEKPAPHKDLPALPDFIDDLRVGPGVDLAPDEAPVAPELERRFATGEPLEVVYFGGRLPGLRRTLTPLRWCEKRGRSHVIARCHQDGMEKTFRLERMHLPVPPLENGFNDFRTISASLPAGFLEGMLMQIAALGNLPIENALAAHHAKHGGFASFFDEYVYGAYILTLAFRGDATSLSFGYEASEAFEIHYEFLPGPEPRLTPGIGTHYALYLGKSHS